MTDDAGDATELLDEPARRRWVPAAVSVVVLVAAVAVGAVLLRTQDSGPSAGRASTRAGSGTAAARTPHVNCAQPPSPAASRAAVRRFPTVAAVLCDVRQRTYPDGVWSVELERVGTRGVAELLAALGRPDQKRSPRWCTMQLDADPMLYLVDAAGRAVHPRYPRDGCGHLQRVAVAATHAIGWRTVSLTKLNLDIPKDPVARACESAWKNMITVESGDARASHGGPVLARDAGQPLIVCHYQMGADPIAGNYVRGTRLPAAHAPELLTALARPAPTTRCTAQRDFVVVHGASGALAYVEVGGCWRVLRDDNTMGAADPATVRRLLGV